MASLVEELITVLEEEEKIYRQLIGYGQQKTDVLILADVPGLEKITCKEQLASDELVSHSNRQIQLLKDIATVLGKTEEKMTVSRLISLLDSQPKVQKRLTDARDRLLSAADQMKKLNDQNIILIRQAIELNEFDLTLFKSLRQAPETANYDKTACNTGSLLGSSGFDAMS
ncbi:MAG: flagellar protein FlgN [Lachnospiraceae bacterium]|nr:flagellar protein FlgN [Agathobacter sp.]MDD6445128.1 flagellar protein FlgN [Lachnospiraceae bacterium]MDY4892268.1 flagellar protein FlgN [Agathobacter sp.]